MSAKSKKLRSANNASIEDLQNEAMITANIFHLVQSGSYTGARADHVIEALRWLNERNLAAVELLKKRAPHLFDKPSADQAADKPTQELKREEETQAQPEQNA